MSDRAAAARKAGLVLVPMDEYLHQGIPGEADAEIIAQHTGYKVLREKLSTIPVDLMKVLKDADIPAYTWTSVNSYMEKALEPYQQEREKLHKKARGYQSLMWLSFCGVVVAVGVGGFSGQWAWGAGIAGCFFALGFLFSMRAEKYSMLSWSQRKRWQAVELKRYRKEIPSAIANRIAKIIRVMPEAQFKVLELTNDPDPFLIVSYKGSDIVIGVWDEPSYEAEIIA